MTMRTAGKSKAEAISVIQRGNSSGASSKNKRADAWQGFYTALMSLKSCPSSSCGTPSTALTEASLSEIGSSHGSSSPRKLCRDTELDEDASDMDMDASDMEASEIDEIAEDSEFTQSLSSHCTRRRPNRRRRARGGRRSAARRARRRAEAAMCDLIDEELTAGGRCPESLPSSREVVLLSDLGFESGVVLGGCPAQSKVPNTPTKYQGPPYNSEFETPAQTSTHPCSFVDTISASGDASARAFVPTCMSTAAPGTVRCDPTSQCTIPANPDRDACASPCASRAHLIREGPAQPGSACLPSGTAWAMPLELRSPQQAPNLIPFASPQDVTIHGSCVLLLTSPCHAWPAPAASTVSTSPMAAMAGAILSDLPVAAASLGSVASTSPMTAPVHTVSMSPMPTSGQCSAVGSASMVGADSRAADTLRSWLQASGLPPAADIVAQLQAAAPDFYED